MAKREVTTRRSVLAHGTKVEHAGGFEFSIGSDRCEGAELKAVELLGEFEEGSARLPRTQFICYGSFELLKASTVNWILTARRVVRGLRGEAEGKAVGRSLGGRS